MADQIVIPKANKDHTNYPCWIPAVRSNVLDVYEHGAPRMYAEARPIVICKCGVATGIGKHHIYKDGTVSNSYYHKALPDDHASHKGCGWHVYLLFEDYDGSEWPPGVGV